MNSILTVVTPSSQILTTLEAVRLELKIADGDTSQDAFIEAEIPRVSVAINNACRRKLIAQDYSEQLRFPRVINAGGSSSPGTDVICLSQYPATVTGIVADGTTLDPAADFECDPASGMVWRLSNDQRTRWCASKVVIAYSGGYDEDNALHEGDLAVLERCAINAIKVVYFARERDPSLRSENVLSGLYSYTLFDPSTPDGSGPFADIERDLLPYVKVDV